MNAFLFQKEQKNSTADAPNTVKDLVEVCPSSQRPGKFDNLDAFFEPVEDQVERKQSYELAPTRDLYVSQIVHVEDTNKCSRIHGRIVLLILKHGANYTCLTFCRHEEQHVVRNQHCQNHAKPVTDANSLMAANEGYGMVHVDVGSRRLKEDVYLNVREHWNLETVNGVKFEVLGKVREEHWTETKRYFAQVFSEAMNGPEPPSSYTGSKREQWIEDVVEVGIPEKHIERPQGHRKKHKPHSPARKARPREGQRHLSPQREKKSHLFW